MIWTPERQASAIAEAKEWHGTPHHDRMRKKAVGVDCINFVCAVLITAGIHEDFRMPGYNTRTGLGRAENTLERVILATFHARALEDREAWEFGDLIIFKVGRASNHIGIWLNDRIWHVQARRFVEPIVAKQSTYDTVQSVLRITDTGFRQPPENIKPEDFLP